MKMGAYEILYIFCNIIGTYIIYNFMSIFFDKIKMNKRFELISYLAYFVLSTIMYLVVDIPIVMMIFNMVAFFLLTLNYNADIKKRIMSSACIYLTLMFVEIIVVVLSGHGYGSVNEKTYYSSMYGLVTIKIFSYITVILLRCFKRIKEGIIMPLIYWLCIFIIPLSSLYIFMHIISVKDLSEMQFVIDMCLLLIMNFSVFYLYDNISNSIEDRIEKFALEQQNIYYQNQFNLMQSSLNVTRMIKHDIKNHFLLVESLMRKNETDEAYEYMDKIMEKMVNNEYINSENIIIDSILNFKLQQAKDNNIETDVKVNVPTNLPMSKIDITVILGNLVDNAINAVTKLESDKRINILIQYNKGRLIINIENTFNGELKYDGKNLLTTNVDEENHGMGIRNIKSILMKYNGIMDVDTKDNVFATFITMYI